MAELPKEIEVVSTAQGERYELPAREVGCLRIAAVPVIAFGTLSCCVGLYISLIEGGLLGLITSGGTSGGGGGKPFSPFFAVFGLPFFLSGLIPVYSGFFMLGGRSTIEIRNDKLIAIQRGGPVRWRRKIPISGVRKFQVKSSGMKDSEVMIGAAQSALNVLSESGRLNCLAWGYPKPTLRALADHLSMRCQTISGAWLLDTDRPAIEVEESVMGQDRYETDNQGAIQEDIPPRPQDTTVIVKPNDVGLTITVPPVGIRKGSKGGLGFSILWNGFMAVFTFFWFYLGGVGIRGELLLICGLLSLFWAVGIGVLIAAINAGRRMAILDVVGDTLLITRQNIFKTRQQEFPREKIKAIRMDKSGTKVNHVPIMNLQVHLTEGGRIAMLGQLTNDELKWIAGQLRQALGVPGR